LSQELERVYTINLGKVLLSPDNQRSKRAINMIKEFARHHMKTKDVKIDEDLAHQVWKRGIKHPPRKIRVRMTKTEEGSVLIAPYEEEIETKVSPEEKSSKLEEKQVEKLITEKPKEVAAEIVEAAEKEIIEKPKKAPAKEKPKPQAKEQKPKAPAKEETPKAQAKQKPTTPAKEETPKKAPAKEEKPKLASFVDPSKGAQHYIDRYNKEKKYKEWFHRNYPNLTIEEAVGLEPSKEKPKAQAKEQKPKAPAKEEKPKKAPTKEEKPKKKSD